MRRERVSTAALTQVLGRLRPRFGERLVENSDIRVQHGNTLSEVPNQPPDAVIFPLSTDEVSIAIRACAEERVPVIPFGAGTSFEGHVNAPFGGISIDTSRMTRIVSISADDMDCRVEAGATREALNHELRTSGLFFPVDPASHATIGGMVATRASGTNAVRYGTMKDAVLSLTAVLGTGEIVVTGTRARKSSAGYDLTRLLVGSEGTLGAITEVGLRLAGIPESTLDAVAAFPSVEAACRTVIQTIQIGVPVARIELLDELQVKACNAYSKLSLPETPLLFVEFQGTSRGVTEEAELFGELARGNGGDILNSAVDADARDVLWTARKNAYWAARALRPGAKGISTDVCVPISALADCVEATKADAIESGLVAPIVGHVGDGNFHVMPLIDYTDPREVAAGQAFVDRLVRRALAFGGTTTGEHGIGQSNKKYLALEFDAPTIGMMRSIKMALDPHDIMNPGKLFDWEAPS
ncbi:MAG: FAD-binding protein [Devosia nanyangense]|uniref:D-lactate dehydrogenase (cytochrome) n=1 Tax=Devosia nanyangense TaxID=1228055 RepID=A0A933L1K6_9HYPH|nr:FAD-binding protein [Devosia nanyangense]